MTSCTFAFGLCMLYTIPVNVDTTYEPTCEINSSNQTLVTANVPVSSSNSNSKLSEKGRKNSVRSSTPMAETSPYMKRLM